MKMAILSRKPEVYSTRRLVEEARKMNIAVSICDPSQGVPSLSASDILLPRLGSYRFEEGLAVVQVLEQQGLQAFNSSEAYIRARNKWTFHGEMRKLQLPVPDTELFSAERQLDFPLIVKLLDSSQGQGVHLVQNSRELKELVQKLEKTPLLIQEWIKESAGEDVRAFVVGDKVIAGMKRRAAPGEFRSNLHCGGSAFICELTPDEISMALQICKHLGLVIAGVDFLRSHRGPLVLEANPCPGFEGIENCTKVNIAGLIIEHIERETRERR